MNVEKTMIGVTLLDPHHTIYVMFLNSIKHIELTLQPKVKFIASTRDCPSQLFNIFEVGNTQFTNLHICECYLSNHKHPGLQAHVSNTSTSLVTRCYLRKPCYPASDNSTGMAFYNSFIRAHSVFFLKSICKWSIFILID